MKQALLVFFGGGFGSLLRYLVSFKLNPLFTTFFLGTFLVNMIGCLLIGFLLTLSQKEGMLSENQTLLLAVGFCGGFTTFSSFTQEGHHLLKTNELIHFSFYTLASVAIGLAALIIGAWLAKLV